MRVGGDNRHITTLRVFKNISIFTNNIITNRVETFLQDILKIRSRRSGVSKRSRKQFPLYYMHSVVCSTRYCVTRLKGTIHVSSLFATLTLQLFNASKELIIYTNKFRLVYEKQKHFYS